MDEASLKGELVKRMEETMKYFVIQRFEESFTHGWPDIGVTGGPRGLTSWWEVKYADPDIKSKEIQRTTLLRLDQASYGRYIIYDPWGKHIRIVEPKDLDVWRTSGLAHPWTRGSKNKHDWLIEQIAGVHIP